MLFMDTASVFSVTQISRYLKELMETDEVLQDVWVRGEISGCKTFPSGHCYFTLKDADAQLPCVFFKNARLRSSTQELRDGMAIVVNGRISLYERDGKMHLYVDTVELHPADRPSLDLQHTVRVHPGVLELQPDRCFGR